MGSQESLETSIRKIGLALGEQAVEQGPTFFHRRWWNGLLLDWGMKDEAFKVQLFRFIDVLPSLKTDAQFTSILREYFGNLKTLPKPLQWSIRALSSTRLASHMGAPLLRKQFLRMAHTFMAGDSIDRASPILTRLWQEGRGYSVDLLGEAVVSEAEADQYRDRCLEALRQLDTETRPWPARPLLEQDHLGVIPRVHLSIKISALFSQLDPMDPDGSFQGVANRLRPILDLAVALPAAITLDMEQAEFKDLTAQIFMRILSEDSYRAYPHGGIALQAYLKDADATLDSLIGWVRKRNTPMTLLLVKGAYWDSETVQYEQRGWPVPVFHTKAETDVNYEALSLKMIDCADLIRPAFATHNLRSLTHAEAAAQAAQLPPHACEYQMLFGMADSLQTTIAEYGRRVRVYAPVGELIPGMAYLVRRLLENTSNEAFIRKQYKTSTPLELLLTRPTSQNGGAVRTEPIVKDKPLSGQKPADEFHNEPHTDFSQAMARSSMAQAIQTVRSRLGCTRSYPLPPAVTPSEPEIVSRNPSAPDEVVARFHGLHAQDIEPLVQSALVHFESWRSTSPDDRADIMLRTAELMRKQRFELAAWEIFETGKPWHEADADVAEAIDFLMFYAREMRHLGQPYRLGHEPGELNHLVLTPRGLVAVIPPWNFPLAIPTGMVSAAVVTGNVVLFKPSERATMMGYWLLTLLTEAGLTQGVLQFLPGGPSLGHALVSHPDVQMIAFTGSKEVGLQILAQASHVSPGQGNVKHVVAEMGGKNAIIVDETADLDEAVTGVLTSFTGYQGQKCSACSRAIVLEPVYDTVVQRMTQAALSLRIGPPEDPGNRMRPLIDERALAKVRQYIEIGKEEGRLILDRQVNHGGYFQGPVIVTEIKPFHRVAQEEIFGPLIAIIRAQDFREAIHYANHTQYALTAGVYSRSPANIQLARESLDVGNLYINRPITGSLVGRQPFGGYRLSGVGKKAGGEGYLQQFMVERVITENTLRRGFAPVE